MSRLNFEDEGLKLRHAAAESLKKARPDHTECVELGQRRLKVDPKKRKKIEQERRELSREIFGR